MAWTMSRVVIQDGMKVKDDSRLETIYLGEAISSIGSCCWVYRASPAALLVLIGWIDRAASSDVRIRDLKTKETNRSGVQEECKR